jgi:hypothetical protein
MTFSKKTLSSEMQNNTTTLSIITFIIMTLSKIVEKILLKTIIYHTMKNVIVLSVLILSVMSLL